MSDKLIAKYQEMSDLTNPKCDKCFAALGPNSCCSKTACEIALDWAREKWNIDLRDKFNKYQKIPFMGKKGCKIAPHFRPACTNYTCAVHAFGFDKNDPDWNTEYWALRQELDDLEWERYDNPEDI